VHPRAVCRAGDDPARHRRVPRRRCLEIIEIPTTSTAGSVRTLGDVMGRRRLLRHRLPVNARPTPKGFGASAATRSSGPHRQPRKQDATGRRHCGRFSSAAAKSFLRCRPGHVPSGTSRLFRRVIEGRRVRDTSRFEQLGDGSPIRVHGSTGDGKSEVRFDSLRIGRTVGSLGIAEGATQCRHVDHPSLERRRLAGLLLRSTQSTAENRAHAQDRQRLFRRRAMSIASGGKYRPRMG
jgi:hypothetical protein